MSGDRQPTLFDLDPSDEPAAAAEASASEVELDRPAAVAAESPPAEPGRESPREGPSFQTLLFGHLVDGVLQLGMLTVVLAGLRLMGIVPGVEDLPALLLFLVLFSLFYSVIPLAFWGRTAGMATVGLVARSREGEPLSFGQAARRWLAGWLVVLSLGLLLLVELRGPSLGDRLSASRTVVDG